MTRNLKMRHVQVLAGGAALVLTLSACGGGGGGGASTTSAPATTPTVGAALDVTPCLNQTVGGRTVASLAVPDVLTLDLTKASGFPNGRQLQDPVIDEILNALFLNVNVNPVDTLAKLPLNPSGNDEPLPGDFPYLATAQGGAPAATGGSGFVFRTDAASAYTRVDRMGAPAVSTALIATADKTAYNDDTPAVDATGKWVPEIKTDLTALTKALKSQLQSAGLTVCATGG